MIKLMNRMINGIYIIGIKAGMAKVSDSREGV